MVSLTSLETALKHARAKRDNHLKQCRYLARRSDEHQGVDDETKVQVDQEIILEENEVLEQERAAILADWGPSYPNLFGEHASGLVLVNPPTPIEVDSPPNWPASPVFLSPKMRPAA